MKSKNVLLVAFALCFTLVSKAQFQKGDWILGGTLGFSSGNASPGSSTTSNTNIDPHIGLSLGDHSMIGFDLGLFTSSNSGDNKNLTIRTDVFYKKYFVLKNKLGWYLQFYGGIDWSKTQSKYFDSAGNQIHVSSTGQIYNLGIKPGIYYRVIPRLLLNVDVGSLEYIYQNESGGYSDSYFSFNLLNNFTFGVDFIIGNR